MKKLLLSSIIMFGICSFATAQDAKQSKSKKTEATPAVTNTFTTAADAQKPAVDAAKKSQVDVAPSDKDAKPVGKNTGTKAAEAKPTTVNANGEVVTDEVAAKKQQDRAAIKAANAKKAKDN